MSDPKRYRDAEQHPALRAAFDAASGDGAPAGTEEKMLAALGLGAATTVAATTATTAASGAPGASGAGAAGGAGASATTAKLLGASALVKWSLAAVVTASLGTAWVVTNAARRPEPASVAVSARASAPEPTSLAPSLPPLPADPSPPEPPAAPSVVAPSATPSATPSGAPLRTPQPIVTAIPALAAATPEAVPSASPLPSPVTSSAGGSLAAPASPLAEELALLAEANAALHRHDAAAANRALDRYDARFAAGSLAVEAEALRVEAVAVLDPPRARFLAKRFVERHPNSPVAPRMRRIADGATLE